MSAPSLYYYCMMRFMYVFITDNLILTKNTYNIWVSCECVWIIFQSTNNNANKYILSVPRRKSEKLFLLARNFLLLNLHIASHIYMNGRNIIWIMSSARLSWIVFFISSYQALKSHENSFLSQKTLFCCFFMTPFLILLEMT